VPGLLSIARYPMRLLKIGMRSSSGGVWEVVGVMKEGHHTDVCNPEMGHMKYLYLKNGSQIKLRSPSRWWSLCLLSGNEWGFDSLLKTKQSSMFML